MSYKNTFEKLKYFDKHGIVLLNTNMHKSIPITIFTGFLGSGKTTTINNIINQNPHLKFGLLINENGDIPIDSQMIESAEEEIVAMANGCICCIVRGDLIKTVEKVIAGGTVDYIIIEASGMAEPKPIADTFVVNNLDGRIHLDSIVTIVDAENYTLTEQNYKTAVDQVQFADIIVLNKVQKAKSEEVTKLQSALKQLNPYAFIVENNGEIDTAILIDTGKWNEDKLLNYKPENQNEHDHHTHEHSQVDEIVFTSKRGEVLDPDKLDSWLKNQFPANCIRAKGILRLKTPGGINNYLFQMVGASKTLVPFSTKRKDVNLDFSRMVLIGKDLDSEKIIQDLKRCVI